MRLLLLLLLVIPGAFWVKVAGTWRSIANAGDIWVKVEDTWRVVVLDNFDVWVKVAGTWRREG